MDGRTLTWVGPSHASTRAVMLGMGLRANELRTAVTAKRAASPEKTKAVRTAKKGTAKKAPTHASAELPKPPTSAKRTQAR